MNYGKIVMVSLVFILFLHIACARGEAPSLAPVEQGATPLKEKVIPEEGWQAEWEKTLKAANKEGSIVVYVTSSIAPPLKDSITLFKRKYGLSLELVTARGTELRGRLLSERANGLFLPDVFIAGLNTIFGDVKPAGATDPLEPALLLPEVVDPKAWYEGKLPWSDEERRVLSFYAFPTPMIGINTELVKLDEIKSYYDLLEPKWKGKIIIGDPTETGIAFLGFSTMLLNKVLDLDFFRKLVSQQNQMTRDQRLHVDWLARGKYPVALWPQDAPVVEYQRAGAPVTFISIKEGTYLRKGGGSMVLINRAPHPNAARIFINWLLSKEGQNIMQNSLRQSSARADLSTEDLDPLKVRKPGEKYFIAASDVEKWVLEEQDKYLELAKQLFGPLMGR